MGIYKNQRLFSDYYLQELLPETAFWKEIKENELRKVFDEIRSIFQKQKATIENLNESQLEERFIRPVLRKLGHIYEVNVSLPRTYEGLKHPDYAFYSSEEAKKAGVNKAVAIGEAKRHGRPLDRKLKTESDPFEVQNPSLQMSRYLWISETHWGILTDGRFWRLYERETSKRLDIFYESDLFKLLEEGTLDEFKYFYLFFRKEAFPNFLQKIYNESLEYAKAVGEELKENVYRALKILAEGFLKTPANNLSSENLEEIHDNCYIFLYRLLFTFYAEARGLLPLDNHIYKDTYSLNSLKNEVKEKTDKKESVSPILSIYWNRLRILFDLVNRGSQSFEISKDDMYVPPYNGGLFDPIKHSFLEKYKVADKWLVEIIGLLACSPSRKKPQEKAFVDYGSLEIRHLGSIYEGLLEYKLKIAETDMVVIKEKGKETWKPKEKIKVGKIVEEVPKGTLYCITDKGERKATGSYYTPNYIVDHIVENTLKPLCDEITNRIHDEILKLEKKIKESRGGNRAVYQRKLDNLKTSFDDEVLKLKVLDPAMGSGHFLVRATEYLAEEIVTNPYAWDEEAPESEVAVMFWRRRVVERCIYGVDLNPLAVELAKLSLWLSTVSEGKPLSFLDHHLRCGNSLIGAKLEDLKTLKIIKKKKKKEPETQLKLFDENKLTQDMALAVGDEVLIETRPTDTLEQVKDKQRILDTLIEARRRKWKCLSNLWIARYFSRNLEKMDRNLFQHTADVITGKVTAILPRIKQLVDEVKKIAEGKHFFHWELEFPEIFFDKFGRKKENPGFDVVIGNPPWITLRGKQRMGISDEEVNYYLDVFKDSAEYKVNSFALFIDKSIELMKNKKGEFGFIIPSTILTNEYLSKIRKKILSKTHLKSVFDLGNRVFGEGVADSIIIIFEKQAVISVEQEVNIFTQIEDLKNNIYKVTSISQKEYLEGDSFVINVGIGKIEIAFFKKIESSSIRMEEIIKNYVGIVTGDNKKFISNKKINLKYKEILVGDDLERYDYNFNSRYVLFDKDLLWSNTDEGIFQLPEKILLRKTGNTLIACLDKNQFYTEQTIYNLFPRIKTDILLGFILTLINSKLMQYYFYNKLITNPEAYPYIKGIHIDQIPIHRISFTTSSNKRKRLFKEAKGLYENYLKNNHWDSILFFVQQRLSTKPEESDVIHDFLAYLAEKMIEYNKAKNEEIKSFLKWLERGIGAEIENLSNKTAIKDYHEGVLNGLLGILKKNNKKLKIDPTRRELQDKIGEEFAKSVTKLNPLKQTINATDNLIDRIVYKLYGLTEEEIKTIEKA